MPAASTLVICDNSDSESSSEISKIGASQRVHPLEFVRSASDLITRVFVNISFSDVNRVSLVRQGLTKLKNIEITVLVDAGKSCHWQTTQAKALGAHRIVKRPYVLDFGDAVEATQNASAPPMSIQAAASALTSVFDALDRDVGVIAKPVIDARKSVINEMSSLGVDAWLAAVKCKRCSAPTFHPFGSHEIPHGLMIVREFLHGRSNGASHKWRQAAA